MQGYTQMAHPGARPNTEEGKPPPRSPGQVEDNTPDLASRRHLPAQTIVVVSALPELVRWGPPQVGRMTRAPLLNGRRRRLLAWVAAAERVVGEGREAVVTAAVAAVVGAALGAMVELVGWLACWKNERRASFSSSEHARLSLGRQVFIAILLRFALHPCKSTSRVRFCHQNHSPTMQNEQPYKEPPSSLAS